MSKFEALRSKTALGIILPVVAGSYTPGNAGGLNQNSSQTARPIVLDLDGNGITVTTKAQGGSVLVDDNGILVLDRNGDGKISASLSGNYQKDSCSRIFESGNGTFFLQTFLGSAGNQIQWRQVA